MKLPKAMIAALVGASFVPGAWAAENNATPEPAVTTPTGYDGTIEVTLEITAKTTIAASTAVFCTVSLGVGSGLGGPGQVIFAEESASIPVTLSGGKGACVVKVPYFWYLVPSPAPISVSMTVGVVAGSTIGTSTTVEKTRSSTRTVGPFHIPSPGATTSFAYSIFL